MTASNSAEWNVKRHDALFGVNGNRLARGHMDIETARLFATTHHYHGFKPCHNAPTATTNLTDTLSSAPTAIQTQACGVLRPIRGHKGYWMTDLGCWMYVGPG
jgi:hypothetical protein